MSDYISDELFHFVGRKTPNNHERNFKVLLDVIRSRCVSSNPPKTGWGEMSVTLRRDAKLEDEKLVTSNITCFCDIPANLLNRHTAKYGCFGLSFHRHMLARCGARPVTYVPKRSDNWATPYGATMLRNIQTIFEGFMRHQYDPNRQASGEHKRSFASIPGDSQESIRALHGILLKDFLAYIKPYDSDLSVDDVNYFYAEREWRRIGSLVFDLRDIQRIVVAEGYESELRKAIPEFQGRVKELALQ